jgi:hypothetical protein
MAPKAQHQNSRFGLVWWKISAGKREITGWSFDEGPAPQFTQNPQSFSLEAIFFARPSTVSVPLPCGRQGTG